MLVRGPMANIVISPVNGNTMFKLCTLRANTVYVSYVITITMLYTCTLTLSLSTDSRIYINRHFTITHNANKLKLSISHYSKNLKS